MDNKITVGVLFGGRSVENEISVVTALQAIEALNKDKYRIVPIYIAKNGKWYSSDALLDIDAYKDMPSLLRRCEEVFFKSRFGERDLFCEKRGPFGAERKIASIDTVLLALHGTNCEDGTVQGLLETIGIPYVGSNTLASANGMDKITMKQILRDSGISVVPFCWFCDKEWDERREVLLDTVEKNLEYPVIVKPANSGSSVGITPAHDRSALASAIDYAAQFTSRIIVEKMLTDIKEVNCSVKGDYWHCEASVCEVPLRSGEILTYSDKYRGNGGSKGAKGGKLSGGAKLSVGAKGTSEGMASLKRELPANLPDEVTSLVQEFALRTFRILGCEGVARVDLMIDQSDSRIYVNEINTIPGSLSSYLWEYSGVPFGKLLDELISRSFARRREEGFKVTDFGDNIFSK